MPITSATTGADPAMQQLWAREMKKEKRKQAVQEAAEVSGEGATLRQKVSAVRLAKETKKKVKEKIKEKAMTPMRTGTTWILRAAWINLISSFGLTLIYINMHVFLRWVFPDAFCKLGEEWVPKQVAPKSAKNIAGTAFGIAEVMGLLLLDILAFFIVIGFLSLIVMISTLIAHPWESVKVFFEVLWNFGFSVFQVLKIAF